MATRIALVDDDQNILTSVSLTLEAEGFEIDCYHDGETALRGLAQRPVELAVLDIKMPRMDGMELLAKLRERSALPVIFLTSKDDERDEEAGFEMGADDYISKPFSLRLLVARIRAILRRSGLDDGTPEGEAAEGEASVSGGGGSQPDLSRSSALSGRRRSGRKRTDRRTQARRAASSISTPW